jgi:hypothetical protein
MLGYREYAWVKEKCFSSFVSFGRKEFICTAAFSILDKFIVI